MTTDLEPAVLCGRCGATLIVDRQGRWHHVAPTKRYHEAVTEAKSLRRWNAWRTAGV
jgi:hypothetical protein